MQRRTQAPALITRSVRMLQRWWRAQNPLIAATYTTGQELVQKEVTAVLEAQKKEQARKRRLAEAVCE